MRFLIAAFFATAVQPLIFLARIAPDYLASPDPPYDLGSFLIVVAVFATPIVLVLWIPGYLLLRHSGRLNWLTLASAGMALGMLPVAPFWPREVPGYASVGSWHGKAVVTYADGLPTTYAWMEYGENLLAFGLHGLVGALVFHASLRRLEASCVGRRVCLRQ